MQYPKEEVDDYQRQLLDIADKLRTSGVCSDNSATLMERYAQKLKETVEEPQPSPEKLVTDLLARCLLWADIIQQRCVAHAWFPKEQSLTVLGRVWLAKDFVILLRNSCTCGTSWRAGLYCNPGR